MPFLWAVTWVLLSFFWRPFSASGETGINVGLHWLLPVYSFLRFEGLFLENKKMELFSSKNFHSCAWHVLVIGTSPVSKITLVLGENYLRQADNSGFPGVNHPCQNWESWESWAEEVWETWEWPWTCRNLTLFWKHWYWRHFTASKDYMIKGTWYL